MKAFLGSLLIAIILTAGITGGVLLIIHDQQKTSLSVPTDASERVCVEGVFAWSSGDGSFTETMQTWVCGRDFKIHFVAPDMVVNRPPVTFD